MNVFQAVKENVTAYDVAVMAGLRPNRSRMICCPFHADRHPSMKVDVRYYCFGCGARGDAIDFAANYYGIGVKEAAEKLAETFGISYDNAGTKGTDRKPYIAKVDERRRWILNKRRLFERISALHDQLRKRIARYEPKGIEDSDVSPLFVCALKDISYVDYLFEYCIFEATDEELRSEYEEMVQEIEKVEKRNTDTEPELCGCDAGQIGERLAV